jgi:hypothetical protein
MKGAIDFELVHASEICREFWKSVYLDAGVKLLVEDESHSFEWGVVEIEYNGEIAVAESLM